MITLDKYGLTPHWLSLYESVATEASALGRVIRQDKGHAIVATEDGEVLAKVRLGKGVPVVSGDWVAVEHETVIAILERHSLLSRNAAHGDRPQALVANVDLVLIVCGADRPLNTRRIERAITQTSEANATPVVVITKIDLMEDQTPVEELRKRLPAINILTLSSKLNEGLDEMRKLMADQTSVMVGESGAGKSTLLNTLVGSEVVMTGEVRESDSKGKHTTVRRELHLLPDGGSLIDTPGVRALGLWADEASVQVTFADVAEVAQQCRFADCKHGSEPGCAVNAAVASGELSAERVAGYLTQVNEVTSTAERIRDSERQRRSSGRRR